MKTPQPATPGRFPVLHWNRGYGDGWSKRPFVSFKIRGQWSETELHAYLDGYKNGETNRRARQPSLPLEPARTDALK
jgi:hypothetical protein